MWCLVTTKGRRGFLDQQQSGASPALPSAAATWAATRTRQVKQEVAIGALAPVT